jgi:hypothetical protein
VGTKAERRAARAHVTAYHQARLGELIEYITAAVDRYRVGEIDAYDEMQPLRERNIEAPRSIITLNRTPSRRLMLLGVSGWPVARAEMRSASRPAIGGL